MRQHVIFIGLPGSGKTTVGRRVAETLGADFIDLDQIIERREGMPVTRVFAERGEPAFRELERAAMADALEEAPAVIAPGGGWAAQPGELARAKERALVIYLKTMITTAVQRTQLHDYRPLLMSDDPYARMRELLQEREKYYAQAHAQVTNGPGPKALDKVVEEVLTLIRQRAQS